VKAVGIAVGTVARAAALASLPEKTLVGKNEWRWVVGLANATSWFENIASA
jgi:hypothetical protein